VTDAPTRTRLDQWISAALWRWMQEDIDIEGLRPEVFDLMRLPVLDEDVEQLNVYFDVLFWRFESGYAKTEDAVAALLELISSNQSPG
jgi:hypothetical protein